MVTKLPKIGPSIKTWLEVMLITLNWRYEVCFKIENVVMILIVNMDRFIKGKKITCGDKFSVDIRFILRNDLICFELKNMTMRRPFNSWGNKIAWLHVVTKL
jgi:hypothetical protein